MKKTAGILLGMALLVLCGSCPMPGEDSGGSDDPDNTAPQGPAKYAEAFWGEWIRMDTGETWYITGDQITVNGYRLGKSPAFTRDSEHVLAVREEGRQDPYYLFASRIANARFSARLVFIGGDASRSAGRDAIGSDGQKPPVRIKDNDQPYKEPVVVQPDQATGEITVEDNIPGDNLEVEIVDPQWSDVKVTIAPADGQDIGTIPLTHGVNFKTSIRTANSTDDIGLLYADGVPHDFIIEVENIGTERCVAATYELVTDDGDFMVVSGSPQGRFDTILPGAKKEISLRLGCRPISTAYDYKNINIKIVGGEGSAVKTWEDAVSVNFYKAKVPFRFSSLKPVQGVVITPRNKTYYFKTSGYNNYYTYSMDVPWSSEDYLVAFSGAAVEDESETVYSLGIDALAATASTLDSHMDLWNYEPNNDEDGAAPINTEHSVISYLHTGDIDYYRINLGDEPPAAKLVEVEEYALEDLPGGYRDGKVNPGDTVNLDIKFRNYTEESRSVTVTGLSADAAHASHVEIIRGSSSYPVSIPPDYYATLTGGYSYNSSGAQLLNSANISRALQFKALDTCPPGSLSLTVHFGDSLGVVYTEEINLEVVEAPVKLEVDRSGGAYTVTGDNDGAANPGETFTLGIKIKNTGTEDASGVTAKLSKTGSGYDGYLTITTGSPVPVGSLPSGGASGSASFNVTLSPSCPAGADIPVGLEFTNGEGNKWSDSVTLHVYPPGPGGVQAAAQSESSVRVSWSGVSGADGYKVYDGSGGVVTVINTGSTLFYDDTGLTAGTAYSYRVSALVGSDESSPSAAVSAKTWARLPAFNRSAGGTVSTGVPEYYRFPVSSGVVYTFTSDKAAAVMWEDGTIWFSLSPGTQTKTPDRTGWAVIKLESAGAYTLTVTSGEAAVSGFVFDSTSPPSVGTVDETAKTIAVLVPYNTSLTSLTPTVQAASGWNCNTTGAKDFTGPVEYSFTKGDAVQAYAVTVTVKGQGGITIELPGGDISIDGFPAAPFTVSRSGGVQTHNIQISDTTYSSYEWYVDDTQKTADAGSGGRAFTIDAADYTIGAHTVTLIVWKDGAPWSNERSFTVTN